MLETKDLSCLWLSYSYVFGSEWTSGIDRILISEIKKALDTKERGVGAIVYLDAPSSRVLYDFNVAYRKIETGVCIDLIVDESPLNIKNEIEYGVVTLFWCNPNDVFNATPNNVLYKNSVTEDAVVLNYAFLKHKNNDIAYFIYLTPSGKMIRKTEIFYEESCNNIKELIDPESYKNVYSFVENQIEKVQEFSVGSMFSDPWPLELKVITDTLNDSKKASYLLTAIVQTIILNHPYVWVVTKKKYPNRQFPTLYFSKTKDKK